MNDQLARPFVPRATLESQPNFADSYHVVFASSLLCTLAFVPQSRQFIQNSRQRICVVAQIGRCCSSYGLGNYHFYAPAGRYLIQITAPQISGTQIFPDVILPADPSSTGVGNNISAFGLTLGGNLSVAGNANISGTLTTSNFNPGTFTPSSLNVLGSETVTGPRPRIDVTAFGAKGDVLTDDTAAIQAAINAACTNAINGINVVPEIDFPSGYYSIKQTQLPSTAPIFELPCSSMTFKGMGNSSTLSFSRAPMTRLVVTPGASPNNAPAFDCRFPVCNDAVTFRDIEIDGYNKAI